MPAPSSKLCEHFHPFQSGDNDVLQAMAWGYTERYRDHRPHP